MNIGMGIALLPLDTRGQAEADFDSGVVAKELRIDGVVPASRACCTVTLALPSLLNGRVISVKAHSPMSCGQRQLCKVVGRVRSAPGDLFLFSVNC